MVLLAELVLAMHNRHFSLLQPLAAHEAAYTLTNFVESVLACSFELDGFALGPKSLTKLLTCSKLYLQRL